MANKPLRHSISEEKIASNTISLSGAGFLGIYHLGAASALHICAPQLVKHGQFYGCSIGALMSACLLCDCDFGECARVVLELARNIRGRVLKTLCPGLKMRDYIKGCLEKMLPDNAHELVTGRLHISITEANYMDWKNVMVSEFASKEELIEVLLCTCHVPYVSSLRCPTYKGKAYIDGSLSCNNPVKDDTTIVVSPFHGEDDICRPVHRSQSCVRLCNTSMDLSKQGCLRFLRIVFPDSPTCMLEHLREGFVDAMESYSVRAEKPCQEHRHLGVGDSKCPECLGLLNEELFLQYFCKAAEVFQQYIEEEEKDVGVWGRVSRTAKNYILKPVGSAAAGSVIACAWSTLEGSQRAKDKLSKSFLSVMSLFRKRHRTTAKDVAEGQPSASASSSDKASVQSVEKEAEPAEPVEPAEAVESAEDKTDAVETDEVARPFVIYLGDEPPENARPRPPRSKDERKVHMYVGSDESDDDDDDDEFVDAISKEDESFPLTSLSSSNSGLSLSNSGLHAEESEGLCKKRRVACLPCHEDSNEPSAKAIPNGVSCDNQNSEKSSATGTTCASCPNVSGGQQDGVSDAASRWQNMRLTYQSNERPVTFMDSRSDNSSGQKNSMKGLVWSDSRLQMI